MAIPAYAETEALRAVLDGRGADASRILADFYPYELRALKDQIGALDEMIDEALHRAEVTGGAR